MGCPPVPGDNPRALASGLSYVQVDKHGITILYHLHECRAHHEIFRAKVGKSGIKEINFVELLLVIDWSYCTDIGLVARVLQPGETQSSPTSYRD